MRIKAGSYFAAGRRPQAAPSWTYFNFLCVTTNIATEFPVISLACCVCININAIARTHTWKLCGLRAVICVLRPAAYFAANSSTGRSTQIAAHRPHGFLCVFTSNRIYVHTHAARKWNCWEFRCAISGNKEKVKICSTRCGLRQSMNWPLVYNWGQAPVILCKLVQSNECDNFTVFIVHTPYNNFHSSK